MSAAAENHLALTGTLVARDAIRFTPAGVALLSFRVAHQSRQSEAGGERRVELELDCLAAETLARLVAAAPLGARLAVCGFLAAKGRSTRRLALHVTDIQFRDKE